MDEPCSALDPIATARIEELMRELERFVILQVVDQRWREHLDAMDYMREGIHLRGMAQKDPLVEYRNEGAIMFDELISAIHEEVVTLLFHAEVTADDSAAQLQAESGANGGNGALSYEHQSLAGADAILAAGGTSTAAATASASTTTPPASAASFGHRDRRSGSIHSGRGTCATVTASGLTVSMPSHGSDSPPLDA